MQVGNARQFGWLRGIVALVLILNLLDAVLTIYWLTAGRAEEANPVMAWFLGYGEVPFVVAKIAVVSLASYGLWRWRRQPIAVVGVFVVFLAYYFLLLYHLRALNLGVLEHWQ